MTNCIEHAAIRTDRASVYVVDDDPSMLKAVDRVLALNGFDTQLFDSGEDLLARANLNAAECLVLDVHLTGMSGIELWRRLSRSGSAIPVIFITAKDDDATRSAAADAGGIAFLVKPFSSAVLMDAVHLALHRRRAEPGAANGAVRRPSAH